MERIDYLLLLGSCNLCGLWHKARLQLLLLIHPETVRTLCVTHARQSASTKPGDHQHCSCHKKMRRRRDAGETRSEPRRFITSVKHWIRTMQPDMASISNGHAEA